MMHGRNGRMNRLAGFPGPRVGLALVLCLGSGALACHDGVSLLRTNVAVRTLTLVEGDGQEAAVATPVPVAPAVRALDQDRKPMEGAKVVFAVTVGGGSIAQDTVVTDERGIASAGEWVLGPDAGRNEVVARAPEVEPFVFTATGLPGAPAELRKIAGDGQSATVGTAVAEAPRVRALDAHGNGVPEVAVTFDVRVGGGSATGVEAVTDSTGAASVGGWTLGTAPGENRLEAASEGLVPVQFTATATPGAPAAMAKVAGDDQEAEVGTSVAVAPAVRVTDSYGNGVPGVTVTFEVTAGGSALAEVRAGRDGVTELSDGSVAGGEAVTDSGGVATVGGWTLGTAAGRNELTATVTELDPVVFVATGLPGPAEVVEKVGGDGQSAAVGTAVAVAPAIRVVDQYGNGVPGLAVAFEVTSGGGTVTGAVATTDTAGEASVGGWTLGTVPGTNTLAATAEGLDPVEFTATATPGTAAGVAKVAGDGQTAEVGTVVATAPAVRVTDRYGNPVPGVTVTFTITGGGGSATGTEPVTDADGVAMVGSWTLGTVAGTKWLTATVAGADPVTFTATAEPGPPTGLAKVRGDGQTTAVGTAVTTPPVVRVVDAYGNGVPGVAVSFTVTDGGGSATDTEAVTDANGEAAVGSWTLGTMPGANTLQATATGLSPVAFTATATAGSPATLAKTGGDGQTAEVATAVATPPAVRVTDSYGNPVAGVAVTFAVTGGGGSVTGAEAVTDADGVAEVGGWTLGTAAGAQALTATVAGLTPAEFTATATAGAPATVTIQAGQDQTATAGTAVPIDPAVLVEDAYGNPVPGVSVDFTVTAGAGTVTGSPATTDAAGIATVEWVLGDPGANTMDATVTGLTPVTFQATAN